MIAEALGWLRGWIKRLLTRLQEDANVRGRPIPFVHRKIVSGVSLSSGSTQVEEHTAAVVIRLFPWVKSEDKGKSDETHSINITAVKGLMHTMRDAFKEYAESGEESEYAGGGTQRFETPVQFDVQCTAIKTLKKLIVKG